MKIAYKHLLRFLKDKPSINDLSSKLYQLGHEHKIDDSIFDIEFTPNRGDCLSLYGLSRDLNIFYKQNSDVQIYSDDIPNTTINFSNNAVLDCPKISFLNIQIDGEVNEYKDYLHSYFECFNLKKNNFFTDISNYLAYELGQPTHAYDADKVNGHITLERNKNDKSFLTLTDEKIIVQESDLVFTNDEEIINLAGIMGGMKSACDVNTKNVLIECAYFKPESIIGRALKYNLKSDASYKFERGTDPDIHKIALRRFIQIVKDHVQIKSISICEDDSYEHINPIIDFDLDKINKILGTNLTEKRYIQTLKNLGFLITNDSIVIPSFRSDIFHQNDLSEEIARIIGYNKIESKEFKINSAHKASNIENGEEKLKAHLVNNGFVEVINYPFSEKNNGLLKIDNPLDSNKSYLRSSLLDSLINNLIYNENRQKDSIKFFEISDIYKFDINTRSIKATKKLAVIISGRQGYNFKLFSKKLDKNYLIDLFNEISIDINQFVTQVNRQLLKTKVKTPIFAIELDLDSVVNNINYSQPVNKKIKKDFVKYKKVSDFPSSYRDLSFLIKDSSRVHDVISMIEKYKSKTLKKSFMFDFYDNKDSNEIKIGYRFLFQSQIKTLTDADIEKELKNIINQILMIESVSIPGLK